MVLDPNFQEWGVRGYYLSGERVFNQRETFCVVLAHELYVRGRYVSFDFCLMV